MNLQNAAIYILDQVKEVLMQIKRKDYNQKVTSLDASIGQHVRHILEFYKCLFEGLENGKVNYDYRQRDRRIETDKKYALAILRGIKAEIKSQTKNKNHELMLDLKYGDSSHQNIGITTNYERELAYNVEHTIHHLAILKQAISEICQYIELPENFGIASSTVRYIKEGVK